MRRALVALLLLLSFTQPAEAASTVPGTLAEMADDRAAGWRADYDDAKAVWRRLRGHRRRELQAVLRATEDLARRDLLTVERAPLVFEVLRRNRDWFATRPPLPYGRRVQIGPLVWQSYPGHGLQPQWLGTFGRANGLFQQGGRDEELRELLDAALALVTPRGFESLFTWQGGRPPWVSAITQGTAAQALARAAVRLGEPRYFTAARAAVVAFDVPAPDGVLAPEGDLLMYSGVPRLRVLNGFAQALVGLHDVAKYTNDDALRARFEVLAERLRTVLPRFDTGAWSLYAERGREADAGYHRLQTQFLRGLCERTADTSFCEHYQRFKGYLRTPPTIELSARRGAVRVRLDKRSTVTVLLRRGARVVLLRTVVLPRGTHAFRTGRGRVSAQVRAVDLVGNTATTRRALRVVA